MSEIDKIIATALQARNGIRMDFRSALSLGVDIVESEVMNLPEHNIPESDRLSYLNTPIFGALEILPGSYTQYNADGTTELIEYEGIVLETVIVNISQRKNIVTTEVTGLDGTVKEYISKGDFQLWAYGAIVGQGQQYPEEKVRTLAAILESPEAVEIRSELLQLFGIDQMVIQAYQLNPKEGFLNTQPFNIRALSDTDIILDLDQTTTL